MKAIHQARAKKENTDLMANLGQLPPNLQVKCIDNDHYLFQIVGDKNNVLEGAYIVAELNLPEDYPQKPPEVIFRNDFKHINVYVGSNKLCLYLINPTFWTANTKLLEIFDAVYKVVHFPTYHDPANKELSDIYLASKQNFEKYMRDVGKRLSDPKYKVM